MAWHCRNPKALAVLDQLAKKLGVDRAEALRIACTHELGRLVSEVPLRERIEGLRRKLNLRAGVPAEQDAQDQIPLRRHDVLFVTGPALAACMLQDEPCGGFLAALDGPHSKFTAAHSLHRAETVLMERGGLTPALAIHGIESFVQLAGIKCIPREHDVRKMALSIRHELRRTHNMLPSEDELLDEACARKFAIAPVMIGGAGRIGHHQHQS